MQHTTIPLYTMYVHPDVLAGEFPSICYFRGMILTRLSAHNIRYSNIVYLFISLDMILQ